MKILIISLAGIGDTLMATPLIHELRKNFPDATLDVLVMWKSSMDILKNNPYVNSVYYFNMIQEGPLKTLKFCRELKRKKYDISINTYPQSKMIYRVISMLIGARLRLSHKYDNWNLLDNLLINRSINQNYNIHCIENNLNLLKLIDGKRTIKRNKYELFLSTENVEAANKFINYNKLQNKILIGMHVGSGTTKNLAMRRWPLDNYIKLIRLILDSNKKTKIILFGGVEEEKDNSRIISEINDKRIIIAKTKNINDCAAIIRRCKVFISVDTALMHIAAAMKVKKQIVIETPTFNKTVEPYAQRFILIKNPAVHGKNFRFYNYNGKGIKGDDDKIEKIMKSVRVEDVFKKINYLIKS